MSERRRSSRQAGAAGCGPRCCFVLTSFGATWYTGFSAMCPSDMVPAAAVAAAHTAQHRIHHPQQLLVKAVARTLWTPLAGLLMATMASGTADQHQQPWQTRVGGGW